MTEHRLPPIRSWRNPPRGIFETQNMSQYRLGKDISVPARRINEIVQSVPLVWIRRSRLSRYFGLSERFWMNLQARYDLEVEKRDRLAGRLEREVRGICGWVMQRHTVSTS